MSRHSDWTDGGSTTVVRREATLDGFVEAAALADGVHLHELEPLTALRVQTRNTEYRILVAEAGDVVVQGGAFFPVATRAHLDGSSLGASLLKLGWIGVGLQMEIRAGGRRIVTTAVRSIQREDAAPAPPH